jgi:O-antigen ligase
LNYAKLGTAGSRRQILGDLLPALAGFVLLLALFVQGALTVEDRLFAVMFIGAVVVIGYVGLGVRRAVRSSAPPCPALTARLSVVEILLILVGLFALVSTAWSLEPGRTAVFGAGLLSSLLYLRLGRLGTGSRYWSAAMVAPTLALFGLGIGVYSLIAYLFDVPDARLVVESTANAAAPFGYPNALAAFVLMTLPCSLGLVVSTAHDVRSGTSAKPWGWLALWSAATVIGIVDLWLSRSRGGALALFAALASWPIVWSLRNLLRLRSISGRARVASVAVVALFLIAVALAGYWLGAHPVSTEQTSGRARLQTWKTAVITAEDKPWFGWGADTFGEATYNYRLGPMTRYAHDLVLQQWVEQGAVGLALLLAFVLVVVVRELPAFWRVSPLRAPPWLLVGVVAFLLHNLIDLGWYFAGLLCLFMLMVGALRALANEGRPT